ncbi:MAG: AlkZ family DNA glycosylase [Actinobacteria bacterium]|nr:AlkZ family DNA glycosylase [Actinomycetota bacterium]
MHYFSIANRVLTERELNRALLARQLLLEPKRLSPSGVIERLVGMQAQWPPAPYVGIWTRTTGFRRETLERELARGTIVKATVMRQTLHLVTLRDYALMRAAMSESNFPWMSTSSGKLAPGVRAFASAGPVTSAEAHAYLEREHKLTGIDARRAWRAARVRAHVLHHHETALWDARPEGRFVAVDEPDAHVPVDARAELLRRYLAAFGPASVRDMNSWSMMHAGGLRASLALLDLRTFRDEKGRELFDVPRAPLPDPDTPAPVRFLPKWDNVLLSFADRTRILPERYRKAIIGMNGDVRPTFLVDGYVAGTWAAEKGRVITTPFGTLPRGAKRELAEEAERLASFLSS